MVPEPLSLHALLDNAIGLVGLRSFNTVVVRFSVHLEVGGRGSCDAGVAVPVSDRTRLTLLLRDDLTRTGVLVFSLGLCFAVVHAVFYGTFS